MIKHLLSETNRLTDHIMQALQESNRRDLVLPGGLSGDSATSAVLCLLGCSRKGQRGVEEPCFVLNKRSWKVRQSGDLCFPGGSIAPRRDLYLSKLLALPFFPLARWPYWNWWRSRRRHQVRRLSLLLAASLRESLEEMRVNPLGIKFLGPMPAQRLQVYPREIYPMVGWIRRQRHFFPNWEVEKIVYIPIRDLLNPNRYACYRVDFDTGREIMDHDRSGDRPCFRLHDQHENEVLWGATYRIVMAFMELVFGFKPPPMDFLPVIQKTLGEAYINKKMR